MKKTHLKKLGVVVATSLGLFLQIGCKHDRLHEESHAHEGEPKTGQITAWGERHEVFAEHRPVVVGKPTEFVTHVTDLESLSPRDDGILKYRLQLGGDAPIEHIESKPARPGIYQATLAFQKAGDWGVSIVIPAEGKEFVVECPPVKVFATEHDAEHFQPPDAPKGITFLKEQQWKVLSKMEPVARRQLTERLSVPAQVRARPGFSASVAAPLAGQIVMAQNKTLPVPGLRVEAGTILALLQPRFSDAGARFVEIEAEFGRSGAVLKLAEATYERTKKLATAQAKSERELHEAEVELATARARHTAASALRSTYAAKPTSESQATVPTLELRAPIAGVVTTISAGIGEPVKADQVLFTILDPGVVWIEGRVPEIAAARLEKPKDALCEVLDGSERMISVGPESGRLVFVGLEIASDTRVVPLIYELKNTNALLRVGQTVRLHVETASVQDALAIPDSALVEEAGMFVAFVQVAGETFEKRELRLGIRDGQWIQVLSGLSGGERVVTKGAYAIRLASVSGVIPAHGHAH